MHDMRRNIFKKADEIVSSDGLAGRGVILPQKNQDSYFGIRDELKEGALFAYMGDTDFNVGTVLTCCGENYVVLAADRLMAFGKLFCSKATLEKVGGA